MMFCQHEHNVLHVFCVLFTAVLYTKFAYKCANIFYYNDAFIYINSIINKYGVRPVLDKVQYFE